MNLDFDALRTSRPDLKVGWDLLEPYVFDKLRWGDTWSGADLVRFHIVFSLDWDYLCDNYIEPFLECVLHLVDLGYLVTAWAVTVARTITALYGSRETAFERGLRRRSTSDVERVGEGRRC
jgi:hypothetical protein